ncbi:50S ribosomal protein L15 [Corynebacterium sp. CCUG 69979]|nr:50S ribosomal protein L15 [Corynebacterium pseudogenitalium]MCQ4624080.1 50S ribosomal protein L15 [Corynebacterium sp. CCUG 69979]
MAEVIKLHDLRPAEGANKAKTRVGRGEASKGKTAGRGTKGTKARKQVSAAFEGGQMPLHMRLPKLKGFKNPNKVIYQVVNVSDLAKAFPEGGTVTTADIADAGLVRKNQPVKVLGDGEISVKLNITAEKFSKSASEKITAAGGTTTEAVSRATAVQTDAAADAADAQGVKESDPLTGTASMTRPAADEADEEN